MKRYLTTRLLMTVFVFLILIGVTIMDAEAGYHHIPFYGHIASFFVGHLAMAFLVSCILTPLACLVETAISR